MAHANRPDGGQRRLRVAEQLRHALSEIMRRGNFRDPDLFDVNVIITEVRISPDLRNATAFVSALAGQDQDKIVKALKRAAPFIRGQIAKSVDLRYTPTIGFQPDQSFDEADKINKLLHKPEVAADLDGLDVETSDPDQN